MNGNSYKNWSAMSDSAIASYIGTYIKHERAIQKRTQEDVSKAAGISRSTLSLLERGEPVNLMTLIQVLRVLDRLYIFESFQVLEQVSPMQLAKEQRVQYRVRKKRKTLPLKPDSTW
jgi:transcriptional regulator with XRE-family HTH domain